MSELFQRMVFNLLIDNTDDHEKNHALLMTESGALQLSPAFDMCPREPEAGVVIPGSDGCRKLRWSRPGMGKQGGARVI
jgi:hypothetical protein